MAQYGLSNYVNEPTRVQGGSATYIDCLLASDFEDLDCRVIDLGLSDHRAVCCRVSVGQLRQVPRKVTYRNFKCFDEHRFRTALETRDWAPFDSSVAATDPESAALDLVGLVGRTFVAEIPLKSFILRQNRVPYMTQEIKGDIAVRNNLRRKSVAADQKAEVEAIERPGEDREAKLATEAKEAHRIARNGVTSKLRRAEAEFERAAGDRKTTEKLIDVIVNSLVPYCH
jgi:hypothetical protein